MDEQCHLHVYYCFPKEMIFLYKRRLRLCLSYLPQNPLYLAEWLVQNEYSIFCWMSKTKGSAHFYDLICFQISFQKGQINIPTYKGNVWKNLLTQACSYFDLDGLFMSIVNGLLLFFSLCVSTFHTYYLFISRFILGYSQF